MKSRLGIVLVSSAFVIPRALAVPPTIHVAWEEPVPPVLDENYRVITDPPASSDFPDVELITGSLTWRVWCTDADNSNNIGDIGIISSPHPMNFGVEIKDDLGGPGARTVKGIILDPTNAGNHSNITGGHITGNLDGDLTVQQSDIGTGGEADFTIDGNASWNITIPTIPPGAALSIGGHVVETVNVGTIYGSVEIGGFLLWNARINVTDSIAGGQLTVHDYVFAGAVIDIAMLQGAPGVRLSLTDPGRGFDGHLVLRRTVPAGQEIWIHGELTPNGLVQLAEAKLYGSIDIGGNVHGIIAIEEGDVPAGGRITIAGNLGGAINVTDGPDPDPYGNVAGAIDVGGTVTGTIDIARDLTGTIAVAGLGDNGTISVDQDVSGSITVSGDVSGTLEAGVITGSVSVSGDAAGTVQVGEISSTGQPFGTLTVNECSGTVQVGVMSGWLTVNEDLSGTIVVTDRVENVAIEPLIEVRGNVTWTGVVDVADILGSATLQFGTDGEMGEFEYTGQLLLQNGLQQDQTLIFWGALNTPGFIDLNDQGVAGHLDDNGGGSGDIINGGVVTGAVELGIDSTTFSGTATFASVQGLGVIATDNCAWLGGTIHITGSMGGAISVSGGTLSGGHVLVDGDISGTVDIAPAVCGNNLAKGSIVANADGIGGGDMTGNVTVEGQFDGDVCADNLTPGDALPGNISINFGNGTVCGAAPCLIAAPTPQAERLPDSEGNPVSTKNRYLSIKAGGTLGDIQAIRVRFVSLPSPFDVWNYETTGQDFFVGEPREACENSGQGLETDPQNCVPALPTDTFWAAPLVCGSENAHFMDWHGECIGSFLKKCVGGLVDGRICVSDDRCQKVVHLYNEGIIPSGVYDIQVIDTACSLDEDSNYSAPLPMTQAKWGDVCGPGEGGGGACSGVADGVVDVDNDVMGVLDKFANINLLQKARADIEPGDYGTNNGPDFEVNVANDVLFTLGAYTGAPYPFVPGDPCNPG